METTNNTDEKKVWQDDVMRGVEYTKALLNYMLTERNQLYGIILKLMTDSNITALTLNEDEAIELGNKYYIFEKPIREERKLVVEKRERE